MPAETALQYEALEQTAQTLVTSFASAGYEPVAPAIIQPADVFLDVVGETLRARTYVFTDPDGDELCMRPDLTIPVCRLHLERDPQATHPAKYSYNGPAFRFQPQGADRAHPREFRQTGIEAFADLDSELAEAEIVGVIVSGLKDAGLEDFALRFGDLGLFRALLGAADMPDRWRQRLLDQFWHPDTFHAELDRLTIDPAAMSQQLPKELRARLNPAAPEESEAIVADYLDAAGIEVVGIRTIREIADQLLARVADASCEPLAPKTAKLIASYVEITAPARASVKQISDLATLMEIDLNAPLAAYERRLDLLEKAGVDTERAEFCAEFGRALEYYTGFVFEVVAPSLGKSSPVAGGGRYDQVLRHAGAPENVPAVGAAIHTQRLLQALAGDA